MKVDAEIFTTKIAYGHFSPHACFSCYVAVLSSIPLTFPVFNANDSDDSYSKSTTNVSVCNVIRLQSGHAHVQPDGLAG